MGDEKFPGFLCIVQVYHLAELTYNFSYEEFKGWRCFYFIWN